MSEHFGVCDFHKNHEWSPEGICGSEPTTLYPRGMNGKQELYCQFHANCFDMMQTACATVEGRDTFVNGLLAQGDGFEVELKRIHLHDGSPMNTVTEAICSAVDELGTLPVPPVTDYSVSEMLRRLHHFEGPFIPDAVVQQMADRFIQPQSGSVKAETSETSESKPVVEKVADVLARSEFASELIHVHLRGDSPMAMVTEAICSAMDEVAAPTNVPVDLVDGLPVELGYATPDQLRAAILRLNPVFTEAYMDTMTIYLMANYIETSRQVRRARAINPPLPK